jgi:hypothetical protein
MDVVNLFYIWLNLNPMIYFKKVYFNYDDRSSIEAALRKVSLKRGRDLDWESTNSNIVSNKYFLGHEGKDSLTFTRLKSSVEILPKIIISLPKSPTDTYYKFRLALFPFILYCTMLLFLLAMIVLLISGRSDFEGFMEGALFPVILIALFFLELKLTSVMINKAIVKYQLL